MRRHLCVVVGRWKLCDWHLYVRREHRAARNPGIRWWDWDLVI